MKPIDAAAAHRWGLDRLRQASGQVLNGRDVEALGLAQTQAVVIPTADGDLPCRLYVPNGASGSPAPFLVFFHGGGFVIGDLETHDAACRRIAAAARARVLSVDYRRAPEHPYPAQIDDAFAAVEWVFAHANDVGADLDAFGIGGDSAGGYLTVAASLRFGGRIKAQLLIYPLLQLNDVDWAKTVFSDSRVVGRVAVRYIRARLATDEIPSLLGTASAASPPTVVVTGGMLDPVRPDALAYAAALEREGAPCVVRQYPSQLHGFINRTHASESARLAMAEIGGLIGGALRDGAFR